MKPFVSSYAAAPPARPWDRAAEAALFDGFARLGFGGLELPFYGERLHAHDEDWLIQRIRPEWRIIVTLLPGTMNLLKDDVHFGLASSDEKGREPALAFAEKAREAILRLNRALGRRAVAAVEVHSAPRLGGSGARSSLEAFARSLTSLRGRDWDGAELLVEHCDAAIPGQEPDKGFLRIEDECVAISLSKGAVPVGALINWGRSAVETRSAQGPLDHLRRAKEAGLLAGLFFSGATPSDPDYGDWKDSHAPFSTTRASSILTPEAAKAALEAAGPVDYVGLKIQPLPAGLGTPERLAMLRDGLDALKA